MLPGFLTSTYKKYKQDTSTFIEWLSENAKECGFKMDELEARSNATPAAPRLKGKQRKLAKQAGAKTSASPAKEKPKSYSISTKDILAQAKAIADSTRPAIEVPSVIIQAGLRAIVARKRCAAYFRGVAGSSSDSRDNVRHSYFIDLMEDALLALQPRFATIAGSSGATPQPLDESGPTSSRLEDLENRFVALDIEEPADEPDEATTARKKPIYEIEPTTKTYGQQEKLFAFFCLFDDLSRLREFLIELWKDYLSDNIDLITAAATTNTAFQLAARTQDEILVAYPDSGDYQAVLSTMVEVLNKNKTSTNDEMEFEMDGAIAEWLYAPAHSILDSFCDVLYPGEVPSMKRGHFGVYDASADRTKMDESEKNRHDLILLLELLPEFAFLAKYKIDPFATDELTRGLSKMCLTKDIPVWLTFATTILLDIHHLAKDQADRAFDQLQAIAEKSKRTLVCYFEFSRGITNPSTWPRENERALQHLAETIDMHLLQDVILKLKEGNYTRLRLPYSVEVERFYLYKRQPILCGLLAFRLTLELQYTGLVLVQCWGTAIYPAHFYNALSQQGQPPPWPLMERLVELHSEDRVFVGGRPKTIMDCYKQVCLVLGYSAEQFAKNRRSKKPVISKNGPRGLKDSSPPGEIFRQGLSSDGSMQLTMHNIDELLNEQAFDTSLTSMPQLKLRRDEWNRSHRLTPIQLLQALKASIPIELPKLRFDYFLLHEQSICLLRRLRESLDTDLKKYVGGGYIENESQLPFVGLYVIMVACGTDRAAEQLGISDAGSLMLQKAIGVFESVAREGF
ncbi:hypothetical protein D0Z07_7314 [Hyphodiscus hymeniophilus]|uniref:DUF6604 domain-containing protein n=1 Tax=Hyphodiscus hymeniophilus TaxID=353542 RepID=A0A9P6VGC2_9HELO|nr:hypothetical protein D0Z07_7314 [Hyphodiscus hymeniophilus]